MQKISLFILGIAIVNIFSLGASESGKPQYSFPAMVGAVALVGKNILVSDKDNGLSLKSFKGDILREYAHGDMRPVRKLVVSHDESLMASSIRDTINIADIETGQSLQEIKKTTEGSDLHRICMSHDKNIITANNYRELCAIDRRSGDTVTWYSRKNEQQSFGDHTLSPSGKEIIFIEYNRDNNLVCVWDTKASPSTRIYRRDFGIWHTQEPMPLSLDHSPDGRQVLVGNWGRLHIIDSLNAQAHYSPTENFTLDTNQGGCSTYVRYNYYGDRFVAVIDPHNLFVIDSQTGGVMHSLKAKGNIVEHFMIPCFGKDALAAVSDSGLVQIWDLSKHSDA